MPSHSPDPALEAPSPQAVNLCFDLRFESLFQAGRGLSFPCDALGHVPLDHLSEKARCNYLFARAMVGRDFATPVVLAHWG